jgi:outer membrane lipoprotein SlyB
MPLLWTGLLVADLAIPDPIPLGDEIMLGTAALHSWQNYFENRAYKKYAKQQARMVSYGFLPNLKKIFIENQVVILIIAGIVVLKIKGMI